MCGRPAGGSGADKRFGRVVPFRFDELDAGQRDILESLGAGLQDNLPRAIVDDEGAVTGAFSYFLLDPRIGGAVVRLGIALTRSLPPRLRELTILEAARALRCDYQWRVHVPIARRAGLTESEIDAVGRGADAPSFDDDERAVRKVVASVLRDRDLPDELYDEALRRLGQVVLYDVVTQAGYYALMSAALVAFRAPSPDDPVAVSAGGDECRAGTSGGSDD